MNDWRVFMERHHPVKNTTKSAFAAADDLSITVEGDAFHIENRSLVKPQSLGRGQFRSPPRRRLETLHPSKGREVVGKLLPPSDH
jgi:hypothetical protein